MSTYLADHFQRPIEWVKAAIHYAAAYPKEIQTAISDSQASNAITLKRLLPHLEIINIASEIERID